MTSQHRKDSSVTGSPPKNLKPKPFWSKNSTCFCPITRWLWAWSAGRFKFQRGNRLGVDVAEMVMKLKRKKQGCWKCKKIYTMFGFPNFFPKIWGFPKQTCEEIPQTCEAMDRLVFRSSTGRTFGSFGGWLQWCGMAIRWGLDIAWNFEVPKI